MPANVGLFRAIKKTGDNSGLSRMVEATGIERNARSLGDLTTSPLCRLHAFGEHGIGIR